MESSWEMIPGAFLLPFFSGAGFVKGGWEKLVGVRDFIAKVEEIAGEELRYRIGGTGKDGTCDCIGLVIGAIRRAGGTWSGLKGTNYTARNEMVALEPIACNSELKVGEVVFKARGPGETGYDADIIRRNYTSSPDKRDYYHIGVVISVYPLRICHMTTPAPKIDTSIGKWDFHGWLNMISKEDMTQEGGEQGMQTVVLYGGILTSPINLRVSDSLRSPILTTVPQYSIVELVAAGKEWTRVRHEGREVYVQTVFVHPIGEASPDAAPGSEACEGQITVSRKKLEALYDEIGDWLGLRG